MIKDDGTIEFEVPGDIKPQSLDIGTGVTYSEAHDESSEATLDQDIRPLQIVMLIVGTRGDVQPFVAIGKHLQVFCIPGFLSISSYAMNICMKNICCTSLLFSHSWESDYVFLWKKSNKLMKIISI